MANTAGSLSCFQVSLLARLYSYQHNYNNAHIDLTFPLRAICAEVRVKLTQNMHVGSHSNSQAVARSELTQVVSPPKVKLVSIDTWLHVVMASSAPVLRAGCQVLNLACYLLVSLWNESTLIPFSALQYTMIQMPIQATQCAVCTVVISAWDQSILSLPVSLWNESIPQSIPQNAYSSHIVKIDWLQSQHI